MHVHHLAARLSETLHVMPRKTPPCYTLLSLEPTPPTELTFTDNQIAFCDICISVHRSLYLGLLSSFRGRAHCAPRGFWGEKGGLTCFFRPSPPSSFVSPHVCFARKSPCSVCSGAVLPTPRKKTSSFAMEALPYFVIPGVKRHFV